MKSLRIYSLLLMVLVALNTTAQQVNKLYAGDVNCMKSVSVDMPFFLENTSTNIVAVQFQLTVPKDVTVSTNSSDAKMEITRTYDHVARISERDKVYNVIVLSSTNTPFKANKGMLFTLKTSVATDADLEEGQRYPVDISNVVLSDSLGNNVMTSYAGGSITLVPCPDFTVSDITVTSESPVTPDAPVTLSWKVNNVGTADSQGGWSEKVTFVSTNTGESCFVTTTHYSQPLNAGANVERSGTVLVPRVLGLDGSFRVEVKIVPNSDSGESLEYQGNNTSLSASSYTLAKKLYLRFPTYDLREGETKMVNGQLSTANEHYFYLERSGSRTEDMTFSISPVNGDSRLQLPATMTISKNSASAYAVMTVNNDGQLNGDTVTYSYTADAANGYQAAIGSGRIIDDDLKQLTLTPSKLEVEEGETFQITITASAANEQTVFLKLSAEQPSRFTMPQKIKLPAGETSVSFDVTVREDNVVNLRQGIQFTASAERYDQGQCEVIVGDNDMPTLDVSFSATTISEDDIFRAIAVTITRKDKTDSSITLRITDDSQSSETNGLSAMLNYSERSITMKPGTTTAKFYISARDNDQMDGDRDVTVTAAVYVKACKCEVPADKGGSFSQVIHIIDNDGPALGITTKQPNMLEGSTDNSLTIKANGTLSSDLAVTVSCTKEDAVAYSKTVTIPAGSSSVELPVSILRNETTGDTKNITFYADADDWSRGVVTVIITDQTLPDATITDFKLVTSEGAVNDSVIVETTIANIGFSLLPVNTPIIFSHGSMEETHYLEADILPGESLTQRDTIALASVAGTYDLYAEVKQYRDVKEITTDNNRSKAVKLEVKPLFTATVKTDKDKYLNTETVTISGQASGMHPYNTEIEVYVVSPSYRYKLMSRTDDSGAFTVEWKPDGNIAGHFGVGACTPGENLKTEMDDFDIYGMMRYDRGYLLDEFEVGEEVEGFFEITNHGTLRLTNIEAQVTDVPEAASFTITGINMLRPGDHKAVYYKYKGLKPSEGDVWEKVKVKFVSAEGAEFEQTLNFYVYSAAPVLKADIEAINTTMVKDQTRDFKFTLRNEGRASTGEITLDLGTTDWLRAATPMKMAPLAQGEEADVVLQFTPTPQMELNSVITGSIAAHCADGSVFVVIPVRVEVVSDAMGTLTVDVVDEYTLNTAEAPHVEGATVSVLHPVTGKLLHKAVTDAQGLVTFDNINEGSYVVKVTHPKHSSWEGSVLVNPSRTTTEQIYIPYSAISIEMSYVKTEVEDEYDITTSVTYETNVPAPVVLMDVPDKIILDEIETPYMYYAHLTNVGLVTAFDARFEVPDTVNGYLFTPLVYGPWDIKPQQTVSIPVLITKADDEAAPSRVLPNYLGRPSEHNAASPRRVSYASAFKCGYMQLAFFFNLCGINRNYKGDSQGAMEHALSEYTKVAEACDFSKEAEGELGFWGSYNWKDGPSGSGRRTYADTGFNSGGPRKPWNSQCDPWLEQHGGEAIKTLVSFAVPSGIASWGFAIGDALEGKFWGIFENLLGTIGGQVIASRFFKQAGSLFDKYIKNSSAFKAGTTFTDLVGEASNLTSLVSSFVALGSMFNNLYSPYTMGDGSDLASFEVDISSTTSLEDVTPKDDSRKRAMAVTGNSGGSLYWAPRYQYTDDNGKTQVVFYHELMSYLDGKISSAYKHIARGVERTKLEGLEEPCFFSEDYPKPELGNVDLPSHLPSAFKAFTDRVVAPLYCGYHGMLMLHEIFGDWKFGFYDGNYLNRLNDHVKTVLASDNPKFKYVYVDKDNGWGKKFSYSAFPAPEPLMVGNALGAPHINDFITRLNNTVAKYNGEEVAGSNYIHLDRLQTYLERIQAGRKAVNRMGYENEMEAMINESLSLMEYMSHKQEGTCAKVKLEFDQKLAMTREAVRGTLTVVNGSEENAMTNVKLDLVVTDPEGNVATPHIMQISTESIDGFEGDVDFESGWTLEADQTGVAKILFIPTKYAAPTEPVEYTFSGTISYNDPFTGAAQTRELEPERLTISPSPNLELTYFMERNIMGDDPMTKEVEPKVPSQFTLLINNKGYGDATKVRMVTPQPKIVSNEKGLMIDFEIVSSQLNGGDKTLALGESVATDFGTIPAHSQAYAQWWMESSLTGHFTNFDVKATHVTSYDNPDLTLLDTVTIHELVHQIVIPTETETTPPLIGFLANDTEDYKDYPDMLYLSNGESYPVSEAANISWTKGGPNRYMLRVQPSAAGWNYGCISDPTGGTAVVAKVLRNSDNTMVPTNYFWQTDRTLLDRLSNIYENNLHFALEGTLETEVYVIDFEPKPAVPLGVSFSGVPTSDAFTRSQVKVVTVSFSRPIDEATFTTDDLKLMWAGEELDVSGLQIVKVNSQTFQFDLRSLTTLDGYYLLTVQTSGITDATGANGVSGQQIGWTQVEDGKATLTMLVEPENAGTVTPSNSKYDFFAELTLTATPANGYVFSGWKDGKKVLGVDNPLPFRMAGNKVVTAVFVPRKYSVKVNYNALRGTVTGGSGQYDYGEEVKLKAESSTGYYFAGWKEGETVVSEDAELTFSVTKDIDYEADFQPVKYIEVALDEDADDNTSAFDDPHGKYFIVSINRHLVPLKWNPFCSPINISEHEVCKVLGYATKIMEYYAMDGDKTLFKPVPDIKAGMPYLVMPEREVTVLHVECDENVVVAKEPKTIEADDVVFCGTYSPYTWGTSPARRRLAAKRGSSVAVNEYFYNEATGSYVMASAGSEALMGFRFYVTAPETINLAGVDITDPETVGINDGQKLMPALTRIYNMQGQYLGTQTDQLPAGLYIINGKKCVIR